MSTHMHTHHPHTCAYIHANMYAQYIRKHTSDHILMGKERKNKYGPVSWLPEWGHLSKSLFREF